MKKEKKLKQQKSKSTLDERRYRMLDLGLKQGRKEVVDKLIELLGLDERYESKHHDSC